MTTSESKSRFFHETNRFELIRITNRIESIRIASWNALVLTAMCRCLGAVPSLPALGHWAPPAERGPSLKSIYRVSLTVDLCEG